MIENIKGFFIVLGIIIVDTITLIKILIFKK